MKQEQLRDQELDRTVEDAPEPVAGPAPRGQCQACGASARIVVLEGYRDGEPLMAHYCAECRAKTHVAARSVESVRESRLSLGTLVCIAGVTIALLGATADLLSLWPSMGFGWLQRTALITGAIVTFLGVLIRVDVVAVGGALTVGIALCFDWVSIAPVPGIGWKQKSVLIGAALLLVVGIAAELKNRLRKRKDKLS